MNDVDHPRYEPTTLPYRVAVLVYLYDHDGRLLLLHRAKAPNAGPSRDWQGFVVSPRAKAKIRQWFAKERREEALEAGKDSITREVRRGEDEIVVNAVQENEEREAVDTLLTDPRVAAVTIAGQSYAIFAPAGASWEWAQPTELVLRLPAAPR